LHDEKAVYHKYAYLCEINSVPNRVHTPKQGIKRRMRQKKTASPSFQREHVFPLMVMKKCEIINEITLQLPLIEQYRLAREKLHINTVPETLPCREAEFLEISTLVENALSDDRGTCIYVSGVPGTGKTATVHEVIRKLQQRNEDRNSPYFRFVEINGMRLSDPQHAYVALWQSIMNDTNTRVTPRHAFELLDQYFSDGKKTGKGKHGRKHPSTMTIVLMDELDLLVTRNQQVIYNFFEWPNEPNSRLIVLAVANTMDLPERILKNKISSRLGINRVNFEAYTHHQLLAIIKSRLVGITAFDTDALELCARKVAAISGDARRVLDICRRAVELVEIQVKEDLSKGKISMQIIDMVYKEMMESPVIMAIQNATLYEKLVLCAFILEFRRIGVSETDFSGVIFL
jgi:origin recognition complex subunit 1